MKKSYENVQMDILALKSEDVITTSDTTEHGEIQSLDLDEDA